MSDVTEQTMWEIWEWLEAFAVSLIDSEPDLAEKIHIKSMLVEDCWHDLVEAHCTLAKRERHHKRVEDVLRARLAAVSDVVAEFRTESDSRKYIDYQGHCVQDMCANRVEEALF